MQYQVALSLSDLRCEMLSRRVALSASAHCQAAEQAAERLVATAQWREADSVLLYMAVRGEMETRIVLELALERGKQVFLPRCPPGKSLMEIAAIRSRQDLSAGRFGILEPCASCRGLDPERDEFPSVALVPGVAFDRRGNRLGHGQGFYDRFFSQAVAGKMQRVGFAHAFQVLDLPALLQPQAWDIPMHALCTEKEFFQI